MKRQATQVRIPQPYHATTRQRRWQIARLCTVIAREFQPDKIILFGSWAYGKPDTDSDIDLLIVMPFEGSPFRQAGTILHRVIQAVGVLPLDLLVKLPSSWTRGSRLVTALYATFWSGAKCCMKPTTFEWIYKAEEGWHVAQMSYRARKYPSYDAAVFHAQQCAVKYLKARLEEAAISRHSYPYPPPETREGKD